MAYCRWSEGDVYCYKSYDPQTLREVWILMVFNKKNKQASPLEEKFYSLKKLRDRFEELKKNEYKFPLSVFNRIDRELSAGLGGKHAKQSRT